MLKNFLRGPFCALLLTSIAATAEAQVTEVRTYNGVGNDGNNNDIRGAAGTQLLRLAPAQYPGNNSGDKIRGEPHFPNPRDVSNIVADVSKFVAAPGGLLLNDRDMSDYVWAWGQFVDHDIDLTTGSADNGTADIEINDPTDILGPDPIPFVRSDFDPTTGTAQNPRQQTNGITAFIDASNVYGSDETRAAALRTWSDGRLKTSAGNLLPFNDGEIPLPNAGGPSPTLFLAGDVRANEQIGLTALHTLFMREHNRLAARVKQFYPGASDEQIYQAARKAVGAELQIITYAEFLPALLGPDLAPSLDDYQGFDPDVDPGIANMFSTAMYRFGHSMLSPTLLLADNTGPLGGIALRDAFFNPPLLKDNPTNLDWLLRGFAHQQAQEVDTLLVDDVRNFLFGPPGAGGLDLASLNIQRGRDHGIPLYNDARIAYGLDPAGSFEHVSSNPAVQAALAAAYDSVHDLDAWVGGLAEDHVPGASVGPLVAASIIEQFTALRDGDRFFFLNDPDLHTTQFRKVIKLETVTLAQVIKWNTSVNNLQPNVFFVP